MSNIGQLQQIFKLIRDEVDILCFYMYKEMRMPDIKTSKGFFFISDCIINN